MGIIKIWRESAEQWSSGAQSAGVIYQVLAVISIISIVPHTQSGLNITKYSLEDPPRPGQYGPVMNVTTNIFARLMVGDPAVLIVRKLSASRG